MTRLRVLERVGRAVGFSPEGRSVRVWVKGMPGADETEVVGGTITEVREGDAVLFLRVLDRPERWLRIVPHESGWGFGALWFSFHLGGRVRARERRGRRAVVREAGGGGFGAGRVVRQVSPFVPYMYPERG